MSLLSRITAPPATADPAAVLAALISSRPAQSVPAKFPAGGPRQMPGPGGLPAQHDGSAKVPEPGPGRLPSASVPEAPPTRPIEAPIGPRMPRWPVGLGTAAVQLPPPSPPPAPGSPVAFPRSLGPTGIGTAPLRLRKEQPSAARVPELYCPEPVRDDRALGETVNERLVEWAEEVGIYPGQLPRVRQANLGRLVMLTHPDSDDADRLLSAAKCALAEWATDDHYMDDESLGADPRLLADRLVTAHAVVAPAQLPPRYSPRLEEAVTKDPVLGAYRSGLEHLGRYASDTQVSRLRLELSVMFVAYNQEAAWRETGRTPEVWEYLIHRHENSFLPCMVLTDAMGGYELPPSEFVDPGVRRVFTMTGLATVLVNDLYSVSKEQDSLDFNLPKLLAAEEGCSLQEAVERTADIHNEIVRTVELESAALSLTGSPALHRFLIGIWNWMGGGREWHRTSARYNGTEGSPSTG